LCFTGNHFVRQCQRAAGSKVSDVARGLTNANAGDIEKRQALPTRLAGAVDVCFDRKEIAKPGLGAEVPDREFQPFFSLRVTGAGVVVEKTVVVKECGGPLGLRAW
jgi:hypothetical protein